MLKLLKHSGTYFYANVSFISQGQITRNAIAGLHGDLKIFTIRLLSPKVPIFPILKKRKNIRFSLRSFVWVPQAARRVRDSLWKHLEGLRWMPWSLPKSVSNKNHFTHRVRGTNVYAQ